MVHPSPSHGLQRTTLQASSITLTQYTQITIKIWIWDLFIKLHDKNKNLKTNIGLLWFFIDETHFYSPGKYTTLHNFIHRER